ncbi:unnamed protein product [Gadus morhua 'NCC']
MTKTLCQAAKYLSTSKPPSAPRRQLRPVPTTGPGQSGSSGRPQYFFPNSAASVHYSESLKKVVPGTVRTKVIFLMVKHF